MKNNSQVKFISWYRRHIYKFLVFKNSFNSKKFINLLKSEISYKKRECVTNHYPRFATIEITNICNLNCPHCPTGKKISTRAKGFLSFDDFKIIIDKLSDYIFAVNLGPNGEPFLNPDIFKMIKYLNEKKISSFISSNFNVVDEEMIGKILDAKPNILNLGIDGISQEKYSMYRKNGNFDKVLKNLTLLLKKRNERNQKWPFVIWQYIIMKQNEDDIDKAKKIAEKIGVDQLAMDMPFIPLPEYWYFGRQSEILDEAKKYFPKNVDQNSNIAASFIENCHLPWKEIHVLIDGTVVPCCRLVEMDVNFGNLIKQPLSEIWNNNFYRAARKNLKLQGRKAKCQSCLATIRKIGK